MPRDALTCPDTYDDGSECLSEVKFEFFSVFLPLQARRK